jgi:hypothetical protein
MNIINEHKKSGSDLTNDEINFFLRELNTIQKLRNAAFLENLSFKSATNLLDNKKGYAKMLDFLKTCRTEDQYLRLTKDDKKIYELYLITQMNKHVDNIISDIKISNDYLETKLSNLSSEFYNQENRNLIKNELGNLASKFMNLLKKNPEQAKDKTFVNSLRDISELIKEEKFNLMDEQYGKKLLGLLSISAGVELKKYQSEQSQNSGMQNPSNGQAAAQNQTNQQANKPAQQSQNNQKPNQQQAQAEKSSVPNTILKGVKAEPSGSKGIKI